MTNKRSRRSGALMISPNAPSFASLRGHVSTTRPPCSTSVRMTASTGSGPRSAIAVTGRVEPSPTIGSVSPVAGSGARASRALCAAARARHERRGGSERQEIAACERSDARDEEYADRQPAANERRDGIPHGLDRRRRRRASSRASRPTRRPTCRRGSAAAARSSSSDASRAPARGASPCRAAASPRAPRTSARRDRAASGRTACRCRRCARRRR